MEKESVHQRSIAKGLTQLRQDRRLTQAELAKILGLSQQRLSEIERGLGSINAEKLVSLLQQFNLPLSFFVSAEPVDEELVLQNAVARLGAGYLRESSDVIVPEKWNYPDDVIVAVLCDHPRARLIPALTPLIVFNMPKINFSKVERVTHDLGLAPRFYWIQEATLQAVQKRLREPHLPKNIKSIYRRVEATLLGTFLYDVCARNVEQNLKAEDFLDPDIISEKTRKLVKEGRDALAKKWHIITRIRQSDFEDALLESEIYV